MKARILVVDDEPVTCKILVRHFSKFGFEVCAANSGHAALDELSNVRYDILVSDIVMPDMNGIELLRSVRKEYPMMHVIMMTGTVTMDHALACMRLGADTICFKPVDLVELDDAVSRAMSAINLWLDILKKLSAMRAASSAKG